MSGGYYFSEMMGSGLALFDYQNDGDLDVYLVQGSALDNPAASQPIVPPNNALPLHDRLYRNDLVPSGELRFVDVSQESGLADIATRLGSDVGSGGYGMGAVAADFDNNGLDDLYAGRLVVNPRTPNPIWAQEKIASYQARWPWLTAVAA